jgi:hypothetical protein
MDDSPYQERFAGAYYQSENPANAFVLEERQRFMRAAADVVPCFGESLFEACCAAINARKVQPLEPAPAAGSGFWAIVAEPIRKWARSFNVETPWVIAEAQSAILCGIRYAQNGIDPMKAFGTWRTSTAVAKAARPILMPVWDFERESQPAYVSRADVEWLRQRDEYIAECKAKIAQTGLTKIPVARKPQFPVEKKFEWAALHQCTKKAFEQIAQEDDVEPKYARSEALAILDRLGLLPPET